MNRPYVGGCACGAIRYEVDDNPVFENHCQCRECRLRSGTGHSSYLTFPDRAKARVTGAARTWRVAGETGSEKTHGFCPTCGTPVFLQLAAMPQLFTIHAGSLDAPERFNPSAVTYNVRALKWDALDPELTRFDKMAAS